jgi:hypothetical protein
MIVKVFLGGITCLHPSHFFKVGSTFLFHSKGFYKTVMMKVSPNLKICYFTSGMHIFFFQSLNGSAFDIVMCSEHVQVSNFKQLSLECYRE